MSWTSVTDRLPENDGFYIVAIRKEVTVKHFSTYAGWTKMQISDRPRAGGLGMGCVISWDRVKVPVTDWQPLPAPPR